MPRRAPVPLDDFVVEDVDYGDSDQEEEEQEGDDDQGSSEEQEDEGSISSEGSESGSEEGEVDEGEGSDGEDCEPPAGARVSELAPAAERGNIPTCPVCMEAWTSEGAHRISCIPCGHVYGRSCLEVVNPAWESKSKCNLPAVWQKRLMDTEQRIIDAGSSKRQNELSLDGARVISIDASNHIILASGRAASVGGEHVLTKVSMFSINEACKIHLPPDTKAVRDMCILPGGHAIFTSQGKRLSLFRFVLKFVNSFGSCCRVVMATDSVVLQCDLPAPGWSCSADISGSHHIYAGLQNGMLLTFDIRKSARPLHPMVGLSMHPIHTLHSVIDSNGSRKVLSASGLGPCMWDVDGNESRPNLLTGIENQRVCISLAYAPPSSDLLVASFRPKVEASSEGDGTASQVYLSQTPTQAGSGKLGHHSLIRRTGKASFAEGATCYASVSEIRMSKSAIIPCGNNQHLLACGEESVRGVRTWQLPCFAVHADLSPHRQAILDLRYAESPGGGRYLGCLSEEKLQVFRIN
ncbi:hypothetical protein PR202_ga27359 [Eleusine coracana subsp. coracana]|uniref:RING-type E3 ubiquitin transferase n=1 Tax=Eleusine coracana subsp. coracana TaxID=191504 RepID=A0AAV5DEL4_ELECO|nr:hypothetical protein PR202_ga27359 [Eleusine coracana subsp. coracana]